MVVSVDGRESLLGGSHEELRDQVFDLIAARFEGFEVEGVNSPQHGFQDFFVVSSVEGWDS